MSEIYAEKPNAPTDVEEIYDTLDCIDTTNVNSRNMAEIARQLKKVVSDTSYIVKNINTNRKNTNDGNTAKLARQLENVAIRIDDMVKKLDTAIRLLENCIETNISNNINLLTSFSQLSKKIDSVYIREAQAQNAAAVAATTKKPKPRKPASTKTKGAINRNIVNWIADKTSSGDFVSFWQPYCVAGFGDDDIVKALENQKQSTSKSEVVRRKHKIRFLLKHANIEYNKIVAAYTKFTQSDAAGSAVVAVKEEPAHNKDYQDNLERADMLEAAHNSMKLLNSSDDGSANKSSKLAKSMEVLEAAATTNRSSALTPAYGAD